MISVRKNLEDYPIRQLHLTNWVVLALFCAAAGVFFTPHMAQSVLVGGLLANISFLLLHRDTAGFFAAGMARPRIVFFVKYYARLAGLALIIYLVVRNIPINVPGFCLGLSTVVASILITTATYAFKLTIVYKEAA